MNEKCVKCNNILSGLVFHDKYKNFVCNNCATEKPYTYPTGEFRKSVEPGEPLPENVTAIDKISVTAIGHKCPCESQSREECQLCRDLNTSRDWERMYHKTHALVMLQSESIHKLKLENAELISMVRTAGKNTKRWNNNTKRGNHGTGGKNGKRK